MSLLCTTALTGAGLPTAIKATQPTVYLRLDSLLAAATKGVRPGLTCPKPSCGCLLRPEPPRPPRKKMEREVSEGVTGVEKHRKQGVSFLKL